MGKTFGENVRLALLERGWPNAELARRIGRSKTQIGNIISGTAPGKKSGKLRLNEEDVEKIIRVLGFPRTVARLSAGLPAINQQQGDPDAATLFYEFSDMDEQGREELRPTMKMMLAEIRRRKAAGELRSQKNPQEA